MAFTHYQLLANCSDEQLRTICERRRLPIPLRWEDEAEGRVRLLKTMVFHLEDHKRLSDTLADLDSGSLVALKHLANEGTLPDASVLETLRGLGLILPDGEGWAVAGRVADALDDFDDGALNFQALEGVKLRAAEPFRFSLALTSVLLRCVAGLRVLKGGLPAKKELGLLMQRNAMLQVEQGWAGGDPAAGRDQPSAPLGGGTRVCEPVGTRPQGLGHASCRGPALPH